MSIRYAVSTMVFWGHEHHLSFEQECDFLRVLGFGIELWPTMKGQTDCRYSRRNWPRLKEAVKDMTVVLNSRKDGPTLEEWSEQIRCAKMLDARVVTDLNSLCISEQFGIADWDFAAEVVKMADDNGVTLCAETGVLEVMTELGSRFDSIRYCIDTGYVYLEGKNRFGDYIDALMERTACLHLSDNRGSFDDHQPPGVRGGMPRKNWKHLLDAVGKCDNDIIACLEISPFLPGALIRQAGDYLFNVLGWPDRPEPLAGCDETAYRPI